MVFDLERSVTAPGRRAIVRPEQKRFSVTRHVFGSLKRIATWFMIRAWVSAPIEGFLSVTESLESDWLRQYQHVHCGYDAFLCRDVDMTSLERWIWYYRSGEGSSCSEGLSQYVVICQTHSVEEYLENLYMSLCRVVLSESRCAVAIAIPP